MRGTVTETASLSSSTRCIPAHAGNGVGGAEHHLGEAVHPRACGERSVAESLQRDDDGASPRMRGTATRPNRAGSATRCIPAHAGNGRTPSIVSSAAAVHPRACGERGRLIATPPFQSGASPRMRGTERVTIEDIAKRRCIPAHAGNGRRGRAVHPSAPVHPRACGERHAAMPYADAPAGASPRMRGTGGQQARRRPVRRCIPAHAGNGSRSVMASLRDSVHPRACGERLQSKRPKGIGIGASPRMRGTEAHGRVSHAPRRCIPAHAGNGLTKASTFSRRSVHPRACGERWSSP